ncbi:MAG: histidine phosphatase family protein [Meiothermus sp.]|nr:histidine phosphatase family protein [Meiothermus sp.]
MIRLMSEAQHIWWIRHGESDSNAGARTANAAAPVLTELGWQQARATAQIFKQAPDRVITTSFVRTGQTAQPLLERFPGLPQAQWPVQEFVELSYRNRNNSNAEEREPKVRAYWEAADPDYHDGEGAESFRQLMARADWAIGAMHKAEPGLTVVYSHGLFMKAMIWQLLRGSSEISQATMRQMFAFHGAVLLPNCALIRFELRDHTLWMQPPDVSHLSLVSTQTALDP